jgi:hypothetical protein
LPYRSSSFQERFCAFAFFRVRQSHRQEGIGLVSSHGQGRDAQMSLCLLLGEALGADQGAVEVSVLACPTNPPVASLVCFAGHLPLLSAPVGSPPERAVLRLLPASKF